LRGRDESDWPILATALGLACAAWTEDADFFGTGVAGFLQELLDEGLISPSSNSFDLLVARILPPFIAISIL
jgi:predicted nucleic acid-binding protein